MSGLRKRIESHSRHDHSPRARARRLVTSVGVASFVVGSMAFVVPVDALAPSAESPAARTSPTSAKPAPLQYVVQDGDYLWGIAIKLNVKFADLLTVNSFTMQTVIHPGQAVVVPDGGALPAAGTPAAATPAAGTPVVKAPVVKAPVVKTPAAVNPGVYTIISGDSLAGIAKRMGVSVPALLSANKLTLTSVIHPGAQLTVPAGGHLPTPTVAAIENGATPSASTGSANRISGTPNLPATTPAGANPSGNGPAAGTNPGAPTLPAGYTSYTIIAGDYLVGIANKSGVTLKALLAANNLITSSAIMPGHQLNVPPPTLPIPALTTVPGSTTTGSATGTVGVTPTSINGSPAGSTPSQQSIAKVLAFLSAQVGKPYVFDSAGPDAYDCSGLVTAAYHQIGIELPHQSQLQSTMGTAVDWLTQPLLPGDLVFQYSSANPTVIGHVGIVMDSTHWIQAAGSGTPVRIGPLPSVSKIRAVRRIVQP